MYIQKRTQKNNIPADSAHFLRTEIDSIDFKNKNVTGQMRKNKAEKSYFLKKIFQKILKQTQLSSKINTYKNIGERNKWNKIGKKYWLCRYKISG